MYNTASIGFKEMGAEGVTFDFVSHAAVRSPVTLKYNIVRATFLERSPTSAI